MKKVIVTGFSIAASRHITGVQRVCRELLLRLDKLLENEPLEVEYVYPEDAPNAVISPDEFRNIKPVVLRPPRHGGKYYQKIWSARRLNRYAKKCGGVGCCLAFEWPFGKRNISYIYDIRAAVTKFDSFSFRAKFKYYLKRCKRGCTLVLTDSDFQKHLICEYFGWHDEKVVTIYPGWEHLQNVVADERIFERYPQLKEHKFYYSLGSLAPHKNFRWVLEVAKRNPDQLFVIAGGKELSVWKDEVEDRSFPNVLFPGRVTDGESKALMQHCKAFLFPSKFEGFGIPPLEALACGARVACSDAACLPEVYGDSVRYFGADDYDVDLEDLLKGPVAPPDKVLAKCSWDSAAEKLLRALKSEAEK